MNNFFGGCNTVEEIKRLYRQLAMKWHPDRGGDTATMQAINAQYQAALKACDGQTTVGSDNQEHTYRYNAQREQAIVEFIDSLIRSGALKANVEAWLIGTWVWIQGDTKPVKDILKGLGCRWHAKRGCWYWHSDEYRSRYNSRVGLDGIAAAYGASRIVSRQEETIVAA